MTVPYLIPDEWAAQVEALRRADREALERVERVLDFRGVPLSSVEDQRADWADDARAEMESD